MKRTHSGSAVDFSISTRRTNAAYEYAQLAEYPCFAALPKDDDTPLEFRVDKTNAFIDLNSSFLEIELQLINKDGTELKTEVDAAGKITKSYNVAPVNNIACALWNNVDLAIAGQQVTKTESLYPWWTYVQQLLHTGENYRKYQLATESCWYQDTAGAFDTFGDDNKGYKARYAIFNDSSYVKIFVPIILNKQFEQLLPPQTRIDLKFNRSPTNLSLLGSKDTQYKMKIWNAKLFAKRIKMNDASLRQYSKLYYGKGFTYPVKAIYTKNFNVSKGDQNVEWTPFVGKLPQKIYLWQISHEAFNADVEKNPYNFQSFQINRLNISKNGVSLPISDGFTEIQRDGYRQLYKLTADTINSESFTFDITDYNFGNLIVAADLTKDDSIRDGTLRISIDYKNPLPGAITLMCMAEFPEVLTINGKTEQVTLSDAA